MTSAIPPRSRFSSRRGFAYIEEATKVRADDRWPKVAAVAGLSPFHFSRLLQPSPLWRKRDTQLRPHLPGCKGAAALAIDRRGCAAVAGSTLDFELAASRAQGKASPRAFRRRLRRCRPANSSAKALPQKPQVETCDDADKKALPVSGNRRSRPPTTTFTVAWGGSRRCSTTKPKAAFRRCGHA